jgi:hypothetical protein
MSDREYDVSPPRENLMQRRLRKARGELIDDEFDDPFYDQPMLPQRNFGNYGHGGCAQASLYLVLGSLAALLIGIFALNQFVTGLGRFFQPPNLGQIIATPTPTVLSSAAVVQRIQALSRLETASYTVQTVIEVQQSQGNPLFDFFAGDAVLLIARGSVVAGIDLGEVEAADVTVSRNGQTITVQLPPARIFSSNLDNAGTRVYSRNRGWFAPENKDLETLARQEAEAQILRTACEDGVLTRATENAETALRQLLGLIEGVTIIVQTAPPDVCPGSATRSA